MRQYKIFKHPTGAIEAVKQGWSWPGAFFQFFWALVKSLWNVALITVGVLILCNMAFYDPNDITILNIILFIVFGINGNKWREKDLLSRGYEQMDFEYAANSDSAIGQHLAHL